MVIFCPARCKRVNFLALPVYSAALSPACFRGFQSECFKRKNSGAGPFDRDNSNRWNAKAFGAVHGTGVFIDAAAHLQVCSALSSHSPFGNHGKAAAKNSKSTVAVYHRRTKEIADICNGIAYVPENRSAAWVSVGAAYRRDLRTEMGRF